MVKLTYRNKQWELSAGMTVRDAILKCGLNPEQVLAVRAGKLIHEATILKDGDEIKLVAVISGGQDRSTKDTKGHEESLRVSSCSSWMKVV